MGNMLRPPSLRLHTGYEESMLCAGGGSVTSASSSAVRYAPPPLQRIYCDHDRHCHAAAHAYIEGKCGTETTSRQPTCESGCVRSTAANVVLPLAAVCAAMLWPSIRVQAANGPAHRHPTERASPGPAHVHHLCLLQAATILHTRPMNVPHGTRMAPVEQADSTWKGTRGQGLKSPEPHSTPGLMHCGPSVPQARSCGGQAHSALAGCG